MSHDADYYLTENECVWKCVNQDANYYYWCVSFLYHANNFYIIFSIGEFRWRLPEIVQTIIEIR